MVIIDGHLHVHKPGNPIAEHELFANEWGATLEELTAEHEEHDVGGAVLVPATPHEENLAYAAECAEAYSGKVAIIGVYDGSVDDPVEAYHETLEEYDVQGLRVTGFNGGGDADPRELDIWPLLEKFADLDHNLWMYPLPDEYEIVAAIAEELPDLNVVWNLLGYPQPGTLEEYVVDEYGRPTLPTMELTEKRRKILLESGKRSNTYAMFGGHFQYADESYPYRDMIDHSQDLLDSFGPEGMFLITDWPWTAEQPGYADLLKLVDVNFPDLSENDRDQIVGGTVQRILNF